MKINHLDIFRIAKDGIYYLDGKFDFIKITPKNGFSGELNRREGGFFVEFYSESEFIVEFKLQSFGEGQTRTALSLGKAKSFCLFLETYGVVIKESF